MLLSKV